MLLTTSATRVPGGEGSEEVVDINGMILVGRSKTVDRHPESKLADLAPVRRERGGNAADEY